jgi:hypothetical protein
MAKQITTKQIANEMTKGGSPVRLTARNLPAFGGWFIETQEFVTMGEPFKSHEAAAAAISKGWRKAWEMAA